MIPVIGCNLDKEHRPLRPMLTPRGTCVAATGSRDLRGFCAFWTALRASAVSLNRLLGRKDRPSFTPRRAVRPVSEGPQMLYRQAVKTNGRADGIAASWCAGRVFCVETTWKDTLPAGNREDARASRKMARRTTLRVSADITEEAPLLLPDWPGIDGIKPISQHKASDPGEGR